MRNKSCIYKSCKSDSRNSTKDYMKGVLFIPFPKPKTRLQECERWIKWLNRDDYPISRVNSSTYLCSKHFVGGKGPSLAFPEPVHNPDSVYINPLNTSTENVEMNKSSAMEPNGNEQPYETCPLVFREPSHGYLSVPTCSISLDASDYTVNTKNVDMNEASSRKSNGNQQLSNSEREAASLKPYMYIVERDKIFKKEIVCKTDEMENVEDDGFQNVGDPQLQSVLTIDNHPQNSKDSKGIFTKLCTFTPPMNWSVSLTKCNLKIRKWDEESDSLFCSVMIDFDLKAHYEALARPITNEDFLANVPLIIDDFVLIQTAIGTINDYKLCIGNLNSDYMKIFQARKEQLGFLNPITGSIHSNNCSLLVDASNKRCVFCTKQRKSYQVSVCKKKKRPNRKFVNMNKDELISALRKSKCVENYLKAKLKRLSGEKLTSKC